MTGEVRTYDPSRNYGFILGEDGARYFTHAGELRGAASLHVGMRVTFTPTKTGRGLRACTVTPLVEEEVR
jgi:cold shock CspA family protein